MLLQLVRHTQVGALEFFLKLACYQSAVSYCTTYSLRIVYFMKLLNQVLVL